MARSAGCTPAQLALAWVLHRAPHIVPIPGTTSVAHLEENLGAAAVPLDPALLDALERLINQGTVTGARYGSAVKPERSAS